MNRTIIAVAICTALGAGCGGEGGESGELEQLSRGGDGVDGVGGSDGNEDTGPGAGSRSGDASCLGFFDCSEGCGSDESCYDRCFATLSSLAQEQVVELIGCVNEHQCSESWCIESYCEGELNACRGGSAEVEQDGGLTCGEIFDCARGCGVDQTCLQSCIDSGSEAGLATMRSLFACDQEHGCYDADCTRRNCPVEYNACLE